MPACERRIMRLAPLALKGGLWIAILVSVAGEDDQVNFFADGSVDDLIQRVKEIHHAHRQGGFLVATAVIGHVDMGIRKMQDA